MKRIQYLIVILAASLFSSCAKDKVKSGYYAPTEVVLGKPDINASDLSVTLSAVYNGDDSGVASAAFVVSESTTGSTVSVPSCQYSDGVAKVTISNLDFGNTYNYNFEVTTPGGNVIKSDETGFLAYCKPREFRFSTQTTLSAKILSVSYTGEDDLIKDVRLSMVDSEGNSVENVPQVKSLDSKVRTLFNLSEWKQDLYDCCLLFTFHDGSTLESEHGKLNLLPVPENIVPEEITFDEDGVWIVSAAYDGEDKTVVKGYVMVTDKEGKEVSYAEAVCADRKMMARVSGLDYGRYYIKYVLEIVDGTSLTHGPSEYVYAKPRAFEEYEMEFSDFYPAGVSTSSNPDPERFTVDNVEWEDVYLQAKPTKNPPYAVWGSSKVGYLCNVTPFRKGIKHVRIVASSGMKDISVYEGYAKATASDEWVKLPGQMIDNKNYLWDLSLDNYQHFKFMTTAQGEFRLLKVVLQYYTEDAVEY